MRWWDTQVAEGEKPLETWARLHLEIESAKHPVMPQAWRLVREDAGQSTLIGSILRALRWPTRTRPLVGVREA